MGWLTEWVDRVLGLNGGGHEQTEQEKERARHACSMQFQHFKRLLGANAKALEAMTDMEDARRGRRVFGMSFIRAKCTTVVVNVEEIIRHLEGIAPGRYSILADRFDDIRRDISALLETGQRPGDVPLVVPLDEVDKSMADWVGSKMANVGEIKNRIGLPVAPGFVVTARGFAAFMDHQGLRDEIGKRLLMTRVEEMSERFELSEAIQRLIADHPLPDALVEALLGQYQLLERATRPGVRVSLRSSALGEDAAGASFAGQFRSILNVGGHQLVRAYKDVVASMYSLPALTYRLNRGIRDSDAAMCVGAMVMLDPVAGGVCYSRSPFKDRDDAVHINSAWGLPKLVVDGVGTPDRFVVARQGAGGPLSVRERRVAEKRTLYVCRPEAGVVALEQDHELISRPSLTDAQATELARLAVLLEAHYGSPQDIEWALEREGGFSILQCRPLSVAVPPRAADAAPGPERDPSAHGEPLVRGAATAAPGVGCGPVHVVERDPDALRFPQGGVLVARFALPKWASLLNWASAVVTEQGSVTGHLANVAREFGVPMITGAAGAVAAVSDGQVATVDADIGAVYPGCVEALLRHAAPRPNLMEGSPVHSLLQEVSRLIVPLNLTDPDAPEFRACNVMTLHDITRFCHEKSVAEMFESSQEREHGECPGKQLRDGVPVQFWVMDLEDGIDGQGEGAFVDLEDIRSVPMLALWDGISAVPWAGPPRVDARGFMTIVLEAATNPALNPVLRSKFANRNYFMITRSYCNLQSRFGFHFSTVEALVTDSPSQNYINFRFAGGAADHARRRRRAVFIAGILEQFGFYSEVRGDSLSSRYEGMPRPLICERLKLLGYLTMHTRQLDMIMANRAAALAHREKILADIYRILPALRPSSRKPLA